MNTLPPLYAVFDGVPVLPKFRYCGASQFFAAMRKVLGPRNFLQQRRRVRCETQAGRKVFAVDFYEERTNPILVSLPRRVPETVFHESPHFVHELWRCAKRQPSGHMCVFAPDPAGEA